MKKIILNVLCAVSVVTVLWMAVSFVDVVKDNTSGHAEHSEHNAFVMMFKEN